MNAARLFQTCYIPSGIHGRRVGRGTQLVFLPLTGTSGLLAMLQHRVRLAGSWNFCGHTRLLRREIPYPLRERCGTRDSKGSPVSGKTHLKISRAVESRSEFQAIDEW